MVFGLDSCRALTRTHLTECSSPKLRPRIYLSSVMKHLSKAMACDAFGEERQKPQKRRRTTSGPKPKLFLWGKWCAGGTRTPDLLVRSRTRSKSKCLFWCRLRTNGRRSDPHNETEMRHSVGGANRDLSDSNGTKIVFTIHDPVDPY